jgi:hypothetical protein
LVLAKGAEDVAVHPNFNSVAMVIASADACLHGGPVPWPSRCAINTDFSPLIDPAEEHAGTIKLMRRIA